MDLYDNPSYSRILIGSRLWSIRGQTHDWRHHYKVFTSAILKWRKVLRTRIIFYVTGQKIRYKKVLPRHWTGSRSQKTKDKALFFRKWYRNNFLAALVYSRARLNHAQTWSSFLYLEFNKPNKQNVSEINLFEKIKLFPKSKQLLTSWLMSLAFQCECFCPFQQVSGHSSELSKANHSPRSTVTQLKCVSDTISNWFENHQPQKSQKTSPSL